MWKGWYIGGWSNWEDWVMNRCSRGTTVLERESARYRSLEQRYRYNKIRVKDYGEYVV